MLLFKQIIYKGVVALHTHCLYRRQRLEPCLFVVNRKNKKIDELDKRRPGKCREQDKKDVREKSPKV